VHPADALRQRQLDAGRSKRPGEAHAAGRRRLCAELFTATAAWLEIDPHDVTRLETSDDLLDALFAILVARALELGATPPFRPNTGSQPTPKDGFTHQCRAARPPD
jgi:hypothetical protein